MFTARHAMIVKPWLDPVLIPPSSDLHKRVEKKLILEIAELYIRDLI